MALLRITGRVVRVDRKNGEKADQTTGELRAWSMTLVKVLVADQDVVEVSMFSDSATPVPPVAAEIDWAVNANVRGTRLNVALDKPWSELFAPAAGDAGNPRHKVAVS